MKKICCLFLFFLSANTFGSEPIQPLPDPQAHNPAIVDLGDRLFHDKRLSHDNTVSCASCHDLQKGGTDLLPQSIGIKGQKGPINSPTVFNSSLNFAQFWDGRAATLEEQADGPVNNPLEMGSNWSEVLGKLKKDKHYSSEFAKLFPDSGLNAENIQHAIATYEKTLITTGSPFDQYLQGYQTAISAQAKRGYELFKSSGCTACHNGPNVGGTMYQKFGLVKDYFADRGNLTNADNGRFNVTKKESDRHVFKVPSLRLVALTPPYFHDASTSDLTQAVKVMGKYQLNRDFSDEEAADIAAFLETLHPKALPKSKYSAE